jgi:predicted ABC-type ATPase
MAHPTLWIVAGPNGAGKTTCVQKQPISAILPNVTFFNPDDLTLHKLQLLGYAGFADAPADVQRRLFVEAANEVFSELERAISRNERVGVETVLSTSKYCALVNSVRERAGFIGLIYIALSSPEIAVERIAARVQRGGHGVPDEKVTERWRRSLEFLTWFASRSTAFYVIDNSDSEPLRLPPIIAFGTNGTLEFLAAEAFQEIREELLKLPL